MTKPPSIEQFAALQRALDAAQSECDAVQAQRNALQAERDAAQAHRDSLIGQNRLLRAQRALLEAAGIAGPAATRLLVADVDETHPFLWTEMMMPVIGLCRVPDVDVAKPGRNILQRPQIIYKNHQDHGQRPNDVNGGYSGWC